MDRQVDPEWLPSKGAAAEATRHPEEAGSGVEVMACVIVYLTCNHAYHAKGIKLKIVKLNAVSPQVDPAQPPVPKSICPGCTAFAFI